MRIVLTLGLVALVTLGCSRPAGPPVVVSDIEITPPRPAMSAGYMTIANNAAGDLNITRVESPQFGRVELHESTIEDGVARMRKLEALTIPPGDSVRLERGGKHLMLMKAAADLDTVTLNFYSDDALLVSVEARIVAPGDGDSDR